MAKKKFIIRDEAFGATLYNRDTLRHKFLSSDDLEEPLTWGDETVESTDTDVWTADISEAPKDLPFSPFRVYFEFTKDCNLRCRTCFNSSGKALEDELNTEEAILSLRGLRSDNVFDVRFTGGEVTQRADWFQILREAMKLGFVVSVNTNGVYNNSETVLQLAELDLDQITMSIDGGKDTHDYIRGRGSFERTVDSLDKLQTLGAPLRINTVLTTRSMREIRDVMEVAAKYVTEINFFYMRPTGRALGISSLMMSYDELHNINREIESMRDDYPHMNILHGVQVVQSNSVDKGLSDRVEVRMGGPDGFTRLNLNSDGSIWAGGYTPHLDSNLILGNIVEEGYTLLNIWRKSEILEDLRKRSEAFQKKCHDCSLYTSTCGGIDLEMELFKQINPEGKNPYCQR